MSFFAELKRRNVFKVAAAYAIVGWLIMQAGDTLAPALHLPEWVNSLLAFFLILGFPLALFFAWAYEMTPEGLKKEKDVDRTQSITRVTGQKLNNLIIGVLVLALAYFVTDKFIFAPGRDQAEIAAAVESAAKQAPAEEKAPAAETDQSIAVLPFVNMSSDPEQEYFSDGITEELLNLLAKIPELRVAARTSSFSFKGKDLEIPEIASRLKVAHVLEGSVRKSGNQVRITAQLIRADNGYHLWSETYDRQLDNIFAIQDEISAAVVEALKVTLLGEAPHTRQTDPEAYRLYLEGQYFFRQRSEEAIARGVDLLEQAVAIDPDYAPAWAELSYARLWMGAAGIMLPDEAAPLATEATERALQLDPHQSLALLTRGIKSMFYDFEFQRGLTEYREAWEADPGSALTTGGYGYALRVMGRMAESVEFQQTGVELDPLSPEGNTNLGKTLETMQRYDEAETYLRKALELSPDFTAGHHRLMRLWLLQGDFAAALTEARKETDTDVYGPNSLAMAYFSMGDAEAAERELNRLLEGGADTGMYQIAEVYAWRGEAGPAFEWLERAVDTGDAGIGSILGDRFFASLWSDPRWQDLLKRLKLWDAWQAMPPEWGGPQA